MFRLRTLGRLELEGPPRPAAQAALKGAKRAGLLVYLARAQPSGLKRRDSLLALFWPDLDQPRARHALRNTLHALRTALGTDLITSAGNEEVGIPEGVLSCDADAFEEALATDRAEDAVALYRGDFLAGFFLPEALEFERWLEAERQRLRRAYHTALERLAEKSAGRGDWPGAVQWWRQAVEGDPYSGRLTQRLMEALEAAGDRAGALKRARQHAELLQQEFGAEPDAGVLALAERLRTESSVVRVHHSEPPGAHDRGPESDQPLISEVAVAQPAKRQFLSGLKWVAALGFAVLASLGVVSWRRQSRSPVLDPQRVVVAPLENRTGDPALDPVGAMAADWIIQGLSQTELVDVTSASATLASARRVQAAAVGHAGVDPIRALAEETGAGLVVTGSYYRQDDSLLFEAHITDARRRTLLRTLKPIRGPVVAPLDAIEVLRQRMLAALAPLLDARLAAHARVASQPPSYEAYRAYAEGMEHYIAGDLHAAIAAFRRATVLDSTYLLPALLTAIAYSNLGQPARADSIGQVLNRSRDHLGRYDRALLDLMLSWQGDDAVATYTAAKRAAAIAPGSLPHVQWAVQALALNRPREAIEILHGIDPTRGEVRGWPSYWMALTSAHHVVGSYRRELKVARRAQHLFPDEPLYLWPEARALAALGRIDEVEDVVNRRLAFANPSRNSGDAGGFMRAVGAELRVHGHAAVAAALYTRAIDWYRSRPSDEQERDRQDIALLYYAAGHDREARALFEQLAVAAPDDVVDQGGLGAIAARHGDRAEAARIASWLGAQDRPYLYGVHFFWQACIAAELGQASEAVALLQKALSHGADVLVLSAHSFPCFDPIRNDQSFRELLRPKG